MKKLLCRIFGHEWLMRPPLSDGKLRHHNYYLCDRCGVEGMKLKDAFEFALEAAVYCSQPAAKSEANDV